MVATNKIRVYGYIKHYILYPKSGEFELFNLNRKNFTNDDFSKCLSSHISNYKLYIYSYDNYLKIINLKNDNAIKILIKITSHKRKNGKTIRAAPIPIFKVLFLIENYFNWCTEIHFDSRCNMLVT